MSIPSGGFLSAQQIMSYRLMLAIFIASLLMTASVVIMLLLL
jgi:hypothetical protein